MSAENGSRAWVGRKCVEVRGAFRSRGTARKAGSLRALFSYRRIEGLRAAAVTSQINPEQPLELVIWNRKWLREA